ncbi:MAG TPA: hypothetical protein VH370_26365 [Humisphaera sp.]|jgi:hypothetical protein|nr:hypothetical protein [Humisphaera sp.]
MIDARELGKEKFSDCIFFRLPPTTHKSPSSTIAQKVHILFYKLLAQKGLQNMTPFCDFPARKHLLKQQLRRSRRRETDQKVMKIRKSFEAANSLPLWTLQQKNFQRSLITGYVF